MDPYVQQAMVMALIALVMLFLIMVKKGWGDGEK